MLGLKVLASTLDKKYPERQEDPGGDYSNRQAGVSVSHTIDCFTQHIYLSPAVNALWVESASSQNVAKCLAHRRHI